MISIIIVNWNGEKWLKKCLYSLVNQSYRKFEIIIVDNASTDNSIAIIKKFFPDVRLIINKTNVGFASANNIGVKKSKGNNILFLNSDTWVDKNFLKKLIKFNKVNNFDIVSPFAARYDSKQYPYYITTIDPLGHNVYLFGKQHSNKKNFYLTGVCLFFSKIMYEKTDGLDNDFFMYCEEVDWFWRLQLLGKTFSYADNIYINHAGAGSTGNGIKYNVFLWRNQNTLQMLLKNYKWYNLVWVLPIYILQNIFEIIFFLLLLKPKIAYSYLEGWLFNVKNFRRTIKKRKKIQKNRTVGDKEIMSRMYFGIGKIHHFMNFYGKK